MYENYEKSAQVLNIKLRRRKYELEGPKLGHFLLRYGFLENIANLQNHLMYSTESNTFDVQLFIASSKHKEMLSN